MYQETDGGNATKKQDLLLFFGLLYYRIDWARHPEKYKDLEDSENDQKEPAKNSSRPGKAGKKRKKK